MITTTIQGVEIARIIAAVLSLHVIVTSAEFLYSRDRFREGGILSWRVAKFEIRTSLLGRLLTPILKTPRFQYFLMLRTALGAAVLFLAVTGTVVWWLLALVFFSNVAMVIRNHVGMSGDYHIGVITTAGLVVAAAADPGSTLYTIALFFIAINLVLSYFIAGALKLFSSTWRSGEGLKGIVATESWGDNRMYSLLKKSPTFSLGASWAVILFETTFPLVLVADNVLLTAFLLGGLLFHLNTAVIMNLNGFLIAFPATYPAVVYANKVVTSWFPVSLGLTP